MRQPSLLLAQGFPWLCWEGVLFFLRQSRIRLRWDHIVQWHGLPWGREEVAEEFVQGDEYGVA